MAKGIKNNIAFMPVVDSISRKFALRREKCTDHFDNRSGLKIQGVAYMGASVRHRYIAGIGSVAENVFFMRKREGVRVPTQADLERREYFSQASAWTNAALKDLTAITANQQKWAQARNDFSKTIKGVGAAGYNQKGWMFAIAYAMVKAGETLPTNHQLPAFDA